MNIIGPRPCLFVHQLRVLRKRVVCDKLRREQVDLGIKLSHAHSGPLIDVLGFSMKAIIDQCDQKDE